MKHEKSRIIWVLGWLLAMLIFLVGAAFEKYAKWFMAFGFIVIAASYIQAYIFCKCPYCSCSLMEFRLRWSGRIHIGVGVPKYCPECGKEIN